MEWKDKNCENCEFKVGGICKRFPPDSDGYSSNIQYLEDEPRYKSACAEYKENNG